MQYGQFAALISEDEDGLPNLRSRSNSPPSRRRVKSKQPMDNYTGKKGGRRRLNKKTATG
eukprot:6429175-Prorocentrum_lima.AAC.1